MFASPELFVETWELASSPKEVSVRLIKEGFDGMTQDVVERWAQTFMEVGVQIKRF